MDTLEIIIGLQLHPVCTMQLQEVSGFGIQKLKSLIGDQLPSMQMTLQLLVTKECVNRLLVLEGILSNVDNRNYEDNASHAD